APHVDLKNVDRVPLEIAATPMNLLSKSLHERLPTCLLVSPSPYLLVCLLWAAIRTRPANTAGQLSHLELHSLALSRVAFVVARAVKSAGVLQRDLLARRHQNELSGVGGL